MAGARRWSPVSAYLDHLPAVFREDPFVGEFLSAFQSVFEGLAAKVDDVARYLDPMTTDVEFLPWLSGWVALTLRAGLERRHTTELPPADRAAVPGPRHPHRAAADAHALHRSARRGRRRLRPGPALLPGASDPARVRPSAAPADRNRSPGRSSTRRSRPTPSTACRSPFRRCGWSRGRYSGVRRAPNAPFRTCSSSARTPCWGRPTR